MYQLDFSKPGKVHFIGIGGISMSGLAEILINQGYTITGSDQKRSDLTDYLVERGAVITVGHRAANITPDLDLVVYTAAIREDNEEYKKAVELGVNMLSRADLLGQIMKNYDQAICISGTHGKTTTTGMVSTVLMNAAMDPTITIGGILPGIGGNGNLRVGGGEFFVCESCEYTNSFLSFFPTVGVILNVAEDHLDFFSGIDDIRNSFREFARRLSADGLLVINKDIDNIEYFMEDLGRRVVTYSVDDKTADITAENVEFDANCFGRYDLICKGEKLGHVELSAPGMHNVSNSLAAFGVCMELGMSFDKIAAGLATFTGAKRRFERKGTLANIDIIDDYAHHPDEIEATLKMALNIKKGKLWCVFQPHTYTRTHTLFNEFVKALSLADEIVLAQIYAAREKNTIGISSNDLAEAIAKTGKAAQAFESFADIEEYILTHAVPGDMVITMGAGDVYLVGEHLLG